jgi:hypothetical protein
MKIDCEQSILVKPLCGDSYQAKKKRQRLSDKVKDVS